MNHRREDDQIALMGDRNRDRSESSKLTAMKPSHIVRLVSSERKTRSKRASFPRYKENVQGRTYVDHTYIDHLFDAPDIPKTISLTDLAAKNISKGPRGGVSVAFPLKLHQMLTTVAEEGVDFIVSWQPHGRCFLVHNKKRFVDEIMPRFFHQSKMTSFQRQLNLYGFNRLTVGKDRGAYYHEFFLRQREHLCERMNRTRIKGNGMKAVPSPSTEPDFYKMPYCPSLFQDEAIQSLNLTASPGRAGRVMPSPRATTTSLASMLCYQSSASPTRAQVVSTCGSSEPSSPVGSTDPYLHQHTLVLEKITGTPNATSALMDCAMARPDQEEEDFYLHPQQNSYLAPMNSLHNGDLAFFEGQQFRYLELSDDEDQENEAAAEEERTHIYDVGPTDDAPAAYLEEV